MRAPGRARRRQPAGSAGDRPDRGWRAPACRLFLVVVLAAPAVTSAQTSATIPAADADTGPEAGPEADPGTGPETAAIRSLPGLREVAAAGAPGLALSLMDEAQPSARDAPAAWAEWERARIGILADARAWRRAIDRLRSTPAGAPEPFRRWALERRAAFLLELDAADEARRLLRELLWDAGPGADEVELRRWRRLVVQSYLVDGRVGDAVTALRRFEQDYRDTTGDWVVLRTRVLLHADRAGEAAARLPDGGDGELAALALLARLRAGEVSPGAAWQRATEAARDADAAPAYAARMWFVAAEAARARSSPGLRAVATEQAVARGAALPPSDTLFALDGDAAWSAWLAFGARVGNEQQLLIGQDDAWFAAAAEALPEYPVRARSLLAVVAQRGGSSAARRQAHDRLVSLLAEGDPGMAAARRAYLHASRYPTLAQVPETVRYRLVDDALARDDLDLATRLMEALSEAPPDVDPFDWRLLRARVLVLGGRIADGAAALDGMLDDYPELQDQRLDRFLQVVFDLQGGREHGHALGLLQRLAQRDLPGKRRRELLYWQAESHNALERHRRAAELYMRSATLLDGRGGDPWGQTARYHAARMLAKAGLVSDARRIYEQLIRVTEDSSRRSTLRRRLQQLGLRDANPADVRSETEQVP